MIVSVSVPSALLVSIPRGKKLKTKKTEKTEGIIFTFIAFCMFLIVLMFSETYEQPLISFGIFLIQLLHYIRRNVRRKRH